MKNKDIILLIVLITIFILSIQLHYTNRLIQEQNSNQNNNIKEIHKKINKLNNNWIESQLNDNNSRTGFYNSGTKQITIYGNRHKNSTDILDTCYHEIGHYIWYEELTTEQRINITNQFKNETNFVSNYSKTNEREYFSENYLFKKLKKSL